MFSSTMIVNTNCDISSNHFKATRSHSAQGLACSITSPAIKIPLPPRPWITDAEDDSSDDIDGSTRDDGMVCVDRTRMRSRYRHYKQRQIHVPIGIFWDIENCQIPRGCSAIDVVAAIRSKFVRDGRREADFVVVCDVRKEATQRLLELNDAQVSLIHVCRTQKNAADDKLRQCMRRFGDLHNAPAAILLISGDIDFAADLSDFRYRKNMEVILVHKRNTSAALIACASSHYCFDELASTLPRKISPQTKEEDVSNEVEVTNLPIYQPAELVSGRLRHLAKKCGGKVVQVTAPTALLRFSTVDHASRALMRMDGEDVYGRKIGIRYARTSVPPTYSSDEGYSTAPTSSCPPPPPQVCSSPQTTAASSSLQSSVSREWALALQQLPAPSPPPHEFCAPSAPKPRQIRGTHGTVNLDRSGCSSSNSVDGRRDSGSRAMSPWNSSASFSEHSDAEESTAELTVSNLPPYESAILQDMLIQLFNQYVPVVRVFVWTAGEGPLATVVLRSEWDARLAIARIHKRRLENKWTGRRLELSLGKPSPAPNLEVLRARLRAILLDQTNHMLPLLRLRDAYASRHCCALTTSDIAKLKDTVIIHEGYGRMVQLIDLTPVSNAEMEEAPWKCHIHSSMNTGQEDGTRILQLVYMEISVLAKNVHVLLENHGGILPLLSFIECYESYFGALVCNTRQGVPLELLLRSVPGVEVRDIPSRHLVWRQNDPMADTTINCSALTTANSESSRSSGERERPRTAPALEPMLALFERELIDLLRKTPRCSIPFSKLIPAFHHRFGRQCRVADYGFTKLPDLLAAISSAIVVLGSGSSRIITISPAAQARCWTSDLVKLLKAQTGRTVFLNDIPLLYQVTFERPFSPVDYGVCTLAELMQRVPSQTVTIAPDGSICLPKRALSPDERARTKQFAVQAVELLSYTPNLSMEFSRFVPAYHAHFGRQLRVAHYGCVKLMELFELIPESVSVSGEGAGDERSVRVSLRVARAIVAQRLRAMPLVSLHDLPAHYANVYGALPKPSMLEVESVEALVYAAGGCVTNGVVTAPGCAPRWSSALLAACAALCADRSIARGSTHDYFCAAFRRLHGSEPDLLALVAAGVLFIVQDARLQLATTWRTVYRLAQILVDISPISTDDLFAEYTRRFEPVFPEGESGSAGVCEFLRQYSEIFTESETARWALCAGIVVPRCLELTPGAPREDYSVYDTPPGQKGSRVFESPKNNIWCSPPASALPMPTALLQQENRRRIRLAAHFDES